MTREEFEKMLRTLEGDALEVLDGEVDGLDPSSPFNPGFDEDATEEDIESLFEDNYYYNFEVVLEGSSGKVGVRGTFAVQDGYVDRIECLNVYDLKELPDDAGVTDGVKIADDRPEMLVVYTRLAELLQA
jgi:hypothetical protein